MNDRFHLLGVKTAHIDILTRRFVATIEPENLKCVLASDFRNYSLSKERKKLLRPLLGDGIFTTDGEEWVLSSFFLRTFLRQWSSSLSCKICECRT